MSKQINFFTTEDDHRELLEIATAFDFKPYDSWQHPEELFENSLFSVDRRPRFLNYVLVRDADFSRVVPSPVKGENYVVFDVMRSYLIQFTPAHFLSDGPRPGRLYFVTGYYDLHGKYQKKSADFLTAADKFFSKIRKCMNKMDDLYYIGGYAASDNRFCRQVRR